MVDQVQATPCTASQLTDDQGPDPPGLQAAGGPTRVENAKIALIQFCVSAPKTDMENSIVINDYTQMDRQGP